MQRNQPKSYSINDFYEWYQKKALALQPKFQRRPVWSKRAKSYLIDTILRGLPVPKLYIRQIIDVTTKKSVREVVDGQQRLRAIFEFVEGALTVSKIHNQEYNDLKFEELPESVRHSFLGYELSVDILLGVSDREVLDIFTRINAYGLVLNAQEKLNARYFGAFKHFVYRLGFDHLEFWRNNLILSEEKISRMAEAELTSELVIAMIDGLQQGKKKIPDFYKKYDDEFSNSDNIAQRFHETMNLFLFVLGETLPKTAFKRVPLFYSLFCVFYDCKYGLPKMNMGCVSINDKNREYIRGVLIEISQQITARETKPGFEEFVLACRRSTDKAKERSIRHVFIYNAIKAAASQRTLNLGLVDKELV